MSISARTTQPMAVPWVASRRGQPDRLEVSLDRRVSLVYDRHEDPVVEPHARVLALELVAVLTVEDVHGLPLEQHRVRAHASDVGAFAAAVIEQVQLACAICRGLAVAVTRDDAPVWAPLREGLAALRVEGRPLAVELVDERRLLTAEDLELTRRPRRRPPVAAAGTAPPPFR